MRAPAVCLRGISRRFGATIANAGVDVEFRPGSIHALVGENGAGKSTLMRILYGLVRPDSGEILIDRHSVALASPAQALANGIGMMHQHFMLVPPMTVLENVVLGYPGLRGLRRLPQRQLAERFRQLSGGYGFDLDPDDRVESLGVGERQRVEITRLLFHGARFLICDEPTAVLAPPEVESLFRILRRFRDEGRTVVFITHKLAEVLDVADRVTVLRRGRVVGEVEREQMQRGQLVRWIMGEGSEGSAESADSADTADTAESGETPEREQIRGGARIERRGQPMLRHGNRRQAEESAALRAEEDSAEVALEARGLSVSSEGGPPALDAVSFALSKGEILGVAGVQGNGQRELAEAVSGRRPFDGGELWMAGRRFVAGARVPAALRPALIPEDRSSEGLIAAMTLWENLLLGSLGEAEFLRHCWYSHRHARLWARPLLQRFRVEPSGADLPADILSGGNQQKLLCAREMSRARGILVAAQPTRGIDLASTAFLHGLLRAVRRRGGSILLISADLDEIYELADRITVLYRGRLSPPLPRAEADIERLGRAMMGIRA